MRRIWQAAAVVAGLGTLGACGQMGDPLEAIGARRNKPDEFRVLARAPLVVPADVRAGQLPPPDPGRRSPLEPDPNRAAAAALLGGEGVAAARSGDGSSAGEALLLRSANAAAASPDIRQTLEEDRVAAASARSQAPYEPPTLLELFGLGDDEDAPDPGIVIDPVAESQRLQREGTPAPNDPRAAVEEAPAPRAEVETFYPPTRSGPPRNALPSDNVQPAVE